MMTKGDRIRQMTDEELAVLINDILNDGLNISYCEDHCPYREQCATDSRCLDPDPTVDIKWWLKQGV